MKSKRVRRVQVAAVEAEGAESVNLYDKIANVLQVQYQRAEKSFSQKKAATWKLSDRFRQALDGMHAASSSASTGFTNIVTALAIKAARPDIDVRKHQVQIGAPFNFRTVSEKAVYPWLAGAGFEGAKSGWQTRTFERPKPYTMSFDENIGKIKTAFLTCYDELEEHRGNASEALAYLIYLQIRLRDQKRVSLAAPTIDDIDLIVTYFEKHFDYTYNSKGASRLPVLAMHAIYSEMMEQLNRFREMRLLPLHSHSAADRQTGSVGDIEVARTDDTIFEALEIKHGLLITDIIVDDVLRKIMPHKVERYYVLTTHNDCRPSVELRLKLKEIRDRIGCQMIVNGVLPTIEYYLRLLTNPGLVLPRYVDLLAAESAISYQHRVVWNDIVIGRV